MENREAIEILRGCVVSEERENGKPNGNITCDLTREVLNMAISALEKQEGKKPTHEASIYKCFTCPTCKNVIDHFEEFVPGQKAKILYKHCHFCGQKILWEE